MANVIADANVFYRLATKRLALNELVKESDRLWYSPIQLFEIVGRLTPEEFVLRRDAAIAIIDSKASPLPDPEVHLALLFGYELKEDSPNWEQLALTLARAPSWEALLGGYADYSDLVRRQLNLNRLQTFVEEMKAEWVQRMVGFLNTHIPGYAHWYDRMRPQGASSPPHLDPSTRARLLAELESEDAWTDFLVQCHTVAIRKAKLYNPKFATKDQVEAIASAIEGLKCYLAVFAQYLASLAIGGFVPRDNDWADHELFIYSNNDDWQIATSDFAWIRRAREAGYAHRVRWVRDRQFDAQFDQDRMLEFWSERGYFNSDPDPAKKAYTIVIPPPNVTGALHMGHALNNTLQDVLIRWHRMKDDAKPLWMPGTDHAGIATQAVVERLVFAQEKKTRHELGRDELVKRIWDWKDKYEARILGQLREIGASCDWRRTRFTLDPVCARAVRETFFQMFKQGYIYRGKRLVNWDTQLQTSVADDETYTEDTKSGFWTFKYPVEGLPDTFISFSTTRPETMLGDTAVCVHPNDERYKSLIGKLVLQPHTGRKIPIIADGLLADPELGTGCVKVTPAHDPNDYACWQRHPEIGIINILNPDGTINENGGEYKGMDRYKAREAVTKKMEELGLYVEKSERIVPMPFSDRSKTPIEPFLSDQWFVKMSDRDDGKPGLAQITMDAVTSEKVKFFPERYKSSYLDWLGEKRDWCISRQLWWGHRIPVWSMVFPEGVRFASDNEQSLREPTSDEVAALAGIKPSWIGKPGWNENTAVKVMPEGNTGRWRMLVCVPPGFDEIEKQLEKDGFTQSEDVLDTWFSSALWPHSTLGWPGPALPEPRADRIAPDWEKLKPTYYPTSTLVTSRDIITLWVARMVLMSLFNLNEIPFRDVYVHPKMLDGFGETMSKTKGNGVDPLDIIELYGTDALRYGIVKIATETQDARLPVSNICPHCGKEVPVKQEHMYMRTKKLTCPECKKEFRPGGPWPTDDPERPTAKQGSDRFEEGRNFANKMWNATRFLLLNLDGYTPGAVKLEELPTEDRWLLSRLATATKAITAALEGYRFSDVARLVYDFVWSEFCDWYIEMSKGRLKDAATRPLAQRVLAGVLDGILRLVQPMMPFVAESLWQALNEAAPERGLPSPSKVEESVVIAKWPSYPEEWISSAVEARFARMQELVRGVREIRNRYQVDDKTRLDVSVKCSEAVAADFNALAAFIGPLAGIANLTAGPNASKPKQAGALVAAEFEAYVSLAGLIDVAAEIKRVEKQLVEKQKALAGVKAKLANEKFVNSAPAEVVQQQRDSANDIEKQIATMEENLKDLRSA